ncbi:MAG: ComEC/Rec2 family competence protein [Candidatus Levybacteria bacterium]|nr:ComEC/Rec2 family competence protein [Candidatus Levybacteria bacterium]
MNKKSFIFWSIFVALAVLRLWQSSTDTRISSDKCLKQHTTGTGKIISEPEKKETGQVFVIFADHFSMIEASEICGEEVAIRVKTKLYPSFSFGDQVVFSGKLLEPTNFGNADGRVFDYVGYLEKDDIYFEIKSANVKRLDRTDTQLSLSDHFKIINLFDSISSQLFIIKKSFVHSLEKNLGEPHSALAGGLVVGEKSALGKQLLDDFRKVGLIHIVVLSGYNITIVADAMRRLLLFLPRFWGIFFGGLGVAIFGILVGGGATVVRSCLMAGIALTADLARRDYSVLRALIFVGLIMLIENPKILLHDPSFQLSFLATLGLIFLARPIENKIGFVTERFGLRGIVASTFATLIFVSPCILYTMGQISIVGVVVNILVLPFVPVTMLFVFLAGVIGMFSTFVATPFAWVSYFLLSYELFMVNNFAKLPFASLNVGQFSPWLVVGFYVIISIIIYRQNKNASIKLAN